MCVTLHVQDRRNVTCDLWVTKGEDYQTITQQQTSGLVMWLPHSRVLNVCNCAVCNHQEARDLEQWVPRMPNFEGVPWVFVTEHWNGWSYNGPWFVGPWMPRLEDKDQKHWEYYTKVKESKPCTERWWME